MFKNFNILIKIFTIGCFVCGNSLFAILPDAKVLESCKQLDEIIQKGIIKLKIPGAIYVVSRHDKILY
ncbi:MAG: hypothetical protein LBE97_00225, partial [Holosporales bacterium]|nr:hypothetical protein [Holosporales bacterium]